MTRILVIESEVNLRQAYRTMLESAGYVVELASDDTDAQEIHNRHPADLVIADLLGMATQAQFQGARVMAVPSILNAKARDAAERARALGADFFLPKPFRRDDLLAAVISTLSLGAL